MNERVKELINQAGIHFSADHQHPGIDTAVVVLNDLEKFAELIIQETLGVVCNVRMDARAAFEVSNRTDVDKFIVDGSAACMVEAVNKHFGVK